MSVRVEVEWVHPRLRVTEVACKRHQREILAALQTLGMGSGTRVVARDEECVRCAAGDAAFRDVIRRWMPGASDPA